MDTRLSDFLTRLMNIRREGVTSPAEVGEQNGDVIEAFYRFLHELGIEHCNFGGWRIDADGVNHLNEFAGSRLSESFLEEYTNEMVEDDYILLRGNDLSQKRPMTRFDIGLNYLDEMKAYHDPAPWVMEECAREGIRDGLAIIGDTSLIRAPGSAMGGRYFGFCFAGDHGTNELIKDNLNALEVATFSLIDQIMPQIEASIDGVQASLTSREREVLAALAYGKQRKEIAFKFNVSLPTVDLHLTNLKRKLSAATLAEAVGKGYRYGIL